MKFKMWLLEHDEKKVVPKFASWSKDGTIIVYIGGRRYEYLTDAVYHDRWERMAKYRPWEVLNQIKKADFSQT